jgi:hypothetical protein
MANSIREEYPKSDSWIKVNLVTNGFQAINTRGLEYIIKDVDSLPLDDEEGFISRQYEGATYAGGTFLYVRNKIQDIKLEVRTV